MASCHTEHMHPGWVETELCLGFHQELKPDRRGMQPEARAAQASRGSCSTARCRAVPHRLLWPHASLEERGQLGERL